MNKGFTLVELSIVLVIIGLLIGGILVAQSLIESAQINRILSRVQQSYIASDAFKDRFRQLAGDFDGFGVRSGDGDERLTGRTTLLTSGYSESVLFWHHLSETNMISESYAGSLGYSTAENDMPQIEGFGGGLYLRATSSVSQGDLGGSLPMYLDIRHITGLGGTSGFVPARIGFLLDAKGDDGLATSGSIQSSATNGFDGCDDSTGAYGEGIIVSVAFVPADAPSGTLVSCNDS